MANPLPTVNGDVGTWGTKLNNFLGVEHDSTNGQHIMGTGLVTENIDTIDSSGTAQTLPSPATATIHKIVLTDNCAITLPTAVAGQSFTVQLKQDGTGGKTVTWTSALWPSAVAPTLTSTANAIDIFVFICIDGTNWLGFTAGQKMS